MTNKPDICIQGTWLKPHLEFILKGYHSIRLDRGTDEGGGCITFIKEGISFRHSSANEHENVITEIFNGDKGKCTVINYYNPCRVLRNYLMRRINKRSLEKYGLGILMLIKVYGEVEIQI